MDEEKVLTEVTITFLRRGNEVLLARKTKKIGKDKWNGYGGGVEPGETPLGSAVREVHEETDGVTMRQEDLERVALVYFHNTKADGTTFTCRAHIYFAYAWDGDVRETEEMATPTWFTVPDLPYGDMMPSDRDWLPRLLAGEQLIVHAYLGPRQQEKLADTEITAVPSLDVP
jgi:ADP-ribose pyrophosphatase YjhB (NUDIX family)